MFLVDNIKKKKSFFFYCVGWKLYSDSHNDCIRSFLLNIDIILYVYKSVVEIEKV